MAGKPRILVSACLLGVRCRYDGGSQAVPRLDELLALCEPIPACPEQLGGLPTPRAPSERVGEKVMSRGGADVTETFRRGAEQALRLAKLCRVEAALMKARSPSCGSRAVYDGSFSGRTVPGAGVTAELLAAHGIQIFDEGQIDALIDRLKGNAL